jgi:hypothetical protein
MHSVLQKSQMLKFVRWVGDYPRWSLYPRFSVMTDEVIAHASIYQWSCELFLLPSVSGRVNYLISHTSCVAKRTHLILTCTFCTEHLLVPFVHQVNVTVTFWIFTRDILGLNVDWNRPQQIDELSSCKRRGQVVSTIASYSPSPVFISAPRSRLSLLRIFLLFLVTSVHNQNRNLDWVTFCTFCMVSGLLFINHIFIFHFMVWVTALIYQYCVSN